ncbi:MAG: ParB/RepB/Spo0J family partition protein [Candidatus Riflebacteria bacterium]|nr:ParB/RepB/Spo0J family partition protein [Candidatus Riflebacteria bacterium]
MLKNSLNQQDKIADVDLTAYSCSEAEVTEMEFRMLPLERVFPNPNQPRKVFDKQALDELAQSIRENGVLQPVLVRSIGDRYQIVSGERRFRASKLAGARTIPAVVRKLDEKQTLLAGLIENIQRQDLNPIEEAKTLKDILLNYGMTHDQLAEKIGRSRSALTNRLRLLQLPAEIQDLVISGKISSGHAKMLAGIKDPLEIKTWTKLIIKDQMSVYEIEKRMAQSRAQQSAGTVVKKGKSAMNRDLHVRAVEDNLQELLGARVRIRQGKKSGRIEIEFYSREDLERVVETMVSLCP